MNRDFEDIFKETEFDPAKMVLRLTAELRDKDLELAAARSHSSEEEQRNNKARETEFEALVRAQEELLARREQDLARQLAEKESGLWQKYQTMLDEAAALQRSGFELERKLLRADLEKKEAELAARDRNLRSEVEALLKTRQTEREAEFRAEREAFREELKADSEIALKEALERARRLEAADAGHREKAARLEDALARARARKAAL